MPPEESSFGVDKRGRPMPPGTLIMSPGRSSGHPYSAEKRRRRGEKTAQSLLFPTARPSSAGEKMVLYNLRAGTRLPTPREQAVADGSVRKLRISPWSSWGSWFGQWSSEPPSFATADLPVPDRWHVTWRSPVSRTAGLGTLAERKNSQREQSGSMGGQDQLCSMPPSPERNKSVNISQGTLTVSRPTLQHVSLTPGSRRDVVASLVNGVCPELATKSAGPSPRLNREGKLES